MNKRLGVAAVLLLIAGALLYFFFNSKHPTLSPIAPSTQNASASQTESSPANHPPGAPSVPSADSGPNSPKTFPSPIQTQLANLAIRTGEVVPDSSPARELPPETVLQNIRRAVRQYGDMFGGNPVGTNPEITSQLSGNNPKHINFINPQPGMRTGKSGELIDPWDTPYFFHQISGIEMEIRSAGPDKIMWTSDDLVVK